MISSGYSKSRHYYQTTTPELFLNRLPSSTTRFRNSLTSGHYQNLFQSCPNFFRLTTDRLSAFKVFHLKQVNSIDYNRDRNILLYKRSTSIHNSLFRSLNYNFYLPSLSSYLPTYTFLGYNHFLTLSF